MPLSSKLIRSASSNQLVGHRYKIVSMIGSGSFADVFLATDMKTKEKIALKLLSLNSDEDNGENPIQEARLLAELSHPHVLQLYDVFVDDNRLCIVTELCSEGTLDDLIRRHKNKSLTRFSEAEIICLMCQLFDGLAYVHYKRILHRDVKTKNIFLDGRQHCRAPVLKLGDFGISKLIATSGQASTMIGTPYYFSPEMLLWGRYNAKSDIWAVGCVMYELCFLRHPFVGPKTLAQTIEKIKDSEPAFSGWRYSSDLRDLCAGLLHKSPGSRPTAQSALKIPLLCAHTQGNYEFHCSHAWANGPQQPMEVNINKAWNPFIWAGCKGVDDHYVMKTTTLGTGRKHSLTHRFKSALFHPQ